jgi:putative ABC transport system substrate-binding protein
VNDRRKLLITLGALPVWSRLHAQAPAGIHRIGVLDPSPSAETRSYIDALHAGLKSLGYDEGRHYVMAYRSAEGKFERLPELAAELVRLQVKVIVARTTPGTQAASRATSSIPIVMADVGDPLGLGFVKTLARPGGNITGPSNATLELLRKRLEILREIVPALGRVAVLGNADDPNTPFQVAEVSSAAKSLRVEMKVFDARSHAQLESALAQIAAWNPQGLLPLVHPLRSAMSPRVVKWAAERRLPVVHAFGNEVEAGGLISYGADLSDQYRRVAVYVDKLLKGARASDLPVERPARYVLVVNLRTAKQIGLKIPPNMLARADKVIE